MSRDREPISNRENESPQILLVEDNPGDVRLVREVFETGTVASSLTTVTDGEAALDYLHRRGDHESRDRPDLVLLDLNVPKVDGKTVLEERQTDPPLRSIPVIVLTSSGTRDDIHKTYELGADGYFVKPVDPNEYFSLIHDIEESLVEGGRVPAGEYADFDPDS